MFTRLRTFLRHWLGIQDNTDEFVEMNEITAGLSLDLGMLREAIGGGVWRTATGFARGIAFLSDTHLKAIMDNSYGGPKARQAIADEQLRRVEDDEWARQQGPGSMRDRLTSLEANVAPMIGQPTRRTITRSEKARILVLPHWAQELIHELAA